MLSAYAKPYRALPSFIKPIEFQHTNLPRPSRLPNLLLVEEEAEDTNPNIPNMNGVVANELNARWSRCYREMMQHLNQRTPMSVIRNQVQTTFGAAANMRGWDESQYRQYYRILWAAEFQHDPRLAVPIHQWADSA